MLQIYELRDPIHSTILFSEREKRVIDHPFVQRLRFIRQMGLKSLVYPGAVHDRFSHCVGAMYVAGRVFAALDTESDVFMRLRPATREYLRNTFRFAALLHDVGHGPFSHASEALMPRFGALAIPPEWFAVYDSKRQATHEDYSVLLIRTLGSRREHIFTADEAQDIASLVHKTVRPSHTWTRHFRSSVEASGYHTFLKRLISGELDVDRMDYLLRDAYFTGVPYGKYDLEWLLHTIGATMTGRSPTLVIKEGGLRAFEDFLLARYHMFLQVYFHRTTAIFEYYVERAIEEHEIPLTIPADVYAYAELRDASVHEAIFAAAKEQKNRWSRLLIDRVPAKCVYRCERTDAASRSRYRTIVRALRAARIPLITRAARRTLAEHLALRPGDSHIFIARKFLGRTEYIPIERASALLKKYNEEIDQIYCYVFPEDYRRALGVLHKKFQKG